MTTLSPSFVADTPASRITQPSAPARVTATIRSFLMLLWLGIRRSQGYWLLPVMIGVGVYAPSIGHLPDIVLWPDMSMATLQSYVIVGPLAAALAAWLVDRDRRHRMRHLMESTPGSGFQRDLLALGTSSFWGLAGYVGVAIWFCGQAMMRATWGGPDVGLMATGAMGVVAFAVIGVLIGRLVASKFSPLLALVATFFLTIGTDLFKITADDGSILNPIQLLMPYGLSSVNYPSVFYRENHGFATEVGLWMVAFVGLLVASLAVLRIRNAGGWLALSGMLLLAGIAAAPLINPPLNWGPQAWTPIDYTPVCESRDGFEICVHPAYESELDETAQRVSSTFGPIQGLDGVASTWNQVNPIRVRDNQEPGVIDGIGQQYGLISSVAAIFPIPGDSSQHGQRPAAQVVIMEWLVQQSSLGLPSLVGSGWFGWPSEVSVSPQDYGNEMTGIGQDQTEMAAFQPRMDAAREQFAALPENEQRVWLEANWDALRAGELTLEDLP